MKQVHNYWLPDSDNHFERLITKRIKNGGPAEYQDDVRDAAYPHVEDFDVCIDVGANVGFWTKPLTEKFKKVIAFEPMLQVYECLEKNVTGRNVEIHRCALGDQNTSAEFNFDEVNTGATAIDLTTLGSGSINVWKLDDLNIPKFGMIKIDCERYDLEVLKGAIETLLKYKPVVVVEQHPDTDCRAGDFLKAHGAKEVTNVRKDFIFKW